MITYVQTLLCRLHVPATRCRCGRLRACKRHRSGGAVQDHGRLRAQAPEHSIEQYNDICASYDLKAEDSIVLAGHSMGGLLTAKMITQDCIHLMDIRPTHIRLLCPAVASELSWTESFMASLLALLPESVTGMIPLPLNVAESGQLWPRSPPLTPNVKQLLASTILRATNCLLFGNAPWDLTPDPDIIPVTEVIASKGDSVVDTRKIRQYTQRHKISYLEDDRHYHEHFDSRMISTIFSGLP